MREISIPIPEIGLIAGTRLALGVGIGLLAADCLSREQRSAAGWALVTIGVLTTLPLAIDVFGRRRCQTRAGIRREEATLATFSR